MQSGEHLDIWSPSVWVGDEQNVYSAMFGHLKKEAVSLSDFVFVGAQTSAPASCGPQNGSARYTKVTNKLFSRLCLIDPVYGC